MKKKKYQFMNLGLTLLMLTSFLQAQTQGKIETKITVETDKPGHAISPMLFGIFFEDINLFSDGGIYPEPVRNRSFEDTDTQQNMFFILILKIVGYKFSI